MNTLRRPHAPRCPSHRPRASLSFIAAGSLFLAVLSLWTAPAGAEYAVVPGSLGNTVRLDIDSPQLWTVASRIVSSPSWLRNVIVVSESEPSGKVVRIRFDVEPDAVLGGGGTLVVALTAHDERGVETVDATRRLPLRLLPSAPEIQASTRIEECCIPSAGVEGAADGRPDRPVLLGAIPNPWSAGTAIRFGLPQPGAVKLRLLDVSGRVVGEISAPALEPGYHELRWDGRDPRGEALPPGLYFYELSSGEWVRTGKTLMLR